MKKRKHERSSKSQLGQFLTPEEKAREIIEPLEVSWDTKVLEPGCGDGSFIIPLIEKFLPIYHGDLQSKLDLILRNNVYGVELDPVLFQRLLDRIQEKFGCCPTEHNLRCEDFLLYAPECEFDYIVGNPPFGGTIDLKHQDELERKYGRRSSRKIKKETYSFFCVKSLDHLKLTGTIIFICSDSFLTINTMAGLRHYLMEKGDINIRRLGYFSEETDYPMVIIEFRGNSTSDYIHLDRQKIRRRDMELTGNFSWTITREDAEYFSGPKIGRYLVCSSGLTTGKNEYFLREIRDGCIEEGYAFEYFDDPITVKNEISRARLNKLSEGKLRDVEEQEKAGAVRRNVRITPREKIEIRLPHKDYKLYNKSGGGVVYEEPRWAIYWKDDGDAVRTFKKNGNWYLHGMGGAPFYEREGITWSLVSSRIKMRYLPPGYIFDSGAPCGFLRDRVERDELFFILGWTLTDLATRLLKQYINHTMNIQSKDVEKLPYPFWVTDRNKTTVIAMMKSLVSGDTDFDIQQLNDWYA